VARLALIGGERIEYHVNSKGRIDFLEASPSERGSSSDRFSSIAQWTVRVQRDEMEKRLARSRVDVGKLESIEPVAFSASDRVSEIEVMGDKGRSRLRGRKIIGALGLRENLFVVDAEKDARGDVVAFVFTGRGWGHGVGLCQTGAFGLAKEGYTYTAILQKYYTGIKLQRMY
jgi:stage II sporulation protein D